VVLLLRESIVRGKKKNGLHLRHQGEAQAKSPEERAGVMAEPKICWEKKESDLRKGRKKARVARRSSASKRGKVGTTGREKRKVRLLP